MQSDLAAAKLHPRFVQSVPIESFGLSQKLRRPQPLNGLMTASDEIEPSGSAIAASFGNVEEASPLAAADMSRACALGSTVGSSEQANTVRSDAITRLLIRPTFLMTILSRAPQRATGMGCSSRSGCFRIDPVDRMMAQHDVWTPRTAA